MNYITKIIKNQVLNIIFNNYFLRNKKIIMHINYTKILLKDGFLNLFLEYRYSRVGENLQKI
jgi:hypothetical protein